MQGNVQLAGEDQLDELRICIIKSFDKLRHRLNSTTAQGWIGNSKSLDALLERMLPPTDDAAPTPVPEQKPTLVLVKKTMLGSTSITTYGLGKRLTIAQMLRALLKLSDDTLINVIEKLAKERKHTLTPEQYEEVLEKQAKFFLKQKGGMDFGLRDDGWANLILVENADGSLSVVDAYWGGRWDRDHYSLDRGGVWIRAYRLVLSNSDALDL